MPELEFKVAVKGGMSVYHLAGRRFPLTLYFAEWIELLAHKEDLLAFLEAHKSELSLRKE